MLTNFDDDDGDGQPDGLDVRLDAVDLDDTVSLQVAPTRVALRALSVQLEPSAVDEVHVFVAHDGGSTWQVCAGGSSGATCALDPTIAQTFATALRVEVVRGRSQRWNGEFKVTLVGVPKRGDPLTSTVTLHVAPVVFHPSIGAPEAVYAAELPVTDEHPRSPFLTTLRETLASLPGTTLRLVNADQYNLDRWAQDAMAVGEQCTATRCQRVLLQADRPAGQGGLERAVEALVAADVGYAFAGRSAPPTWLDSGGNLEVTPPRFPEFPLGQLVVGGGETDLMGAPSSRHVGAEKRAWLEAQGAQTPILELDTSWLQLGHVDEVVSFVAAPKRARGWAVLLPDPDRTLEWLARAPQRKALTVGCEPRSVLVNELLSTPSAVEFNHAAARRLAHVREQLKTALSLSDDDFVGLPALYAAGPGNDAALAVPWLGPGSSVVALGSTVIVPRLCGPAVLTDAQVKGLSSLAAGGVRRRRAVHLEFGWRSTVAKVAYRTVRTPATPPLGFAHRLRSPAQARQVVEAHRRGQCSPLDVVTVSTQLAWWRWVITTGRSVTFEMESNSKARPSTLSARWVNANCHRVGGGGRSALATLAPARSNSTANPNTPSRHSASSGDGRAKLPAQAGGAGRANSSGRCPNSSLMTARGNRWLSASPNAAKRALTSVTASRWAVSRRATVGPSTWPAAGSRRPNSRMKFVASCASLSRSRNVLHQRGSAHSSALSLSPARCQRPTDASRVSSRPSRRMRSEWR